MRNFMRKTARRRVSDAQPSNWARLCLKNDIFRSVPIMVLKFALKCDDLQCSQRPRLIAVRCDGELFVLGLRLTLASHGDLDVGDRCGTALG